MPRRPLLPATHDAYRPGAVPWGAMHQPQITGVGPVDNPPHFDFNHLRRVGKYN